MRRNGRCFGNSSIAVCSAAGERAIDSWMNGRATLASAVKVVSRLTNSCAWVSATGATSAAASPSAWNSRASWVSGSARLRATGSRYTSSGRRSTIASLMSSPRPASAVPNASRVRCDPRLVFESKTLNTSSISTGSGCACAAGMVAPASNPSSDSPGSSSMYFSPSAERGRMIIVESTGKRVDLLLELHLDDRRGRLVALPRDRCDLGDRAHALAADADVVADDEIRRVVELGLQVVRRHERQAAVGVVGKEDRDDRHEQGDRPDQDRAAQHARCAAPPRHPSFPSR